MHLHLHCARANSFPVSREQLDALHWNLVSGYGSTGYALHAYYEWDTMHVLMRAPLFRISGSTGRIIRKFGALWDPLPMRFTPIISGGYLQVCKCTRASLFKHICSLLLFYCPKGVLLVRLERHCAVGHFNSYSILWYKIDGFPWNTRGVCGRVPLLRSVSWRYP